MLSFLKIILLVIAITNCFADDVETPISKMTLTLPDKFKLYEIDLGETMGKCDLIADSEQNYMFTILKFDVKINDEFMAGLTDSTTKQGGKNTKIKVTGHKGLKITAIKTILPNETRIYVPYPQKKTVVLVQIEGKNPEDTEQFKSVISTLR